MSLKKTLFIKIVKAQSTSINLKIVRMPIIR
jgi:hypothetical protein